MSIVDKCNRLIFLLPQLNENKYLKMEPNFPKPLNPKPLRKGESLVVQSPAPDQSQPPSHSPGRGLSCKEVPDYVDIESRSPVIRSSNEDP